MVKEKERGKEGIVLASILPVEFDLLHFSDVHNSSMHAGKMFRKRK